MTKPERLMNLTRQIPRIMAGILIVFLFTSGCLDSTSDISLSSMMPGTGSCRQGYSVFSTSQGHCCPSDYPHYYNATCHPCAEGYYKFATSDGVCCPKAYPYYYNGKCHSGSSSGSTSCSPGYAIYSTSQGHCCTSTYPHYYNGTCHQCAEGYYKFDTSAGYCCPKGYPYYYDGKCHSQASGSSSSGTSTVVISDIGADSRTGCPAQRDLQCSGWIEAKFCQVQSCTCYYSDIHGDTAVAYYHTSDNGYYRCSGSGQAINCVAAAEAAVSHCSG